MAAQVARSLTSFTGELTEKITSLRLRCLDEMRRGFIKGGTKFGRLRRGTASVGDLMRDQGAYGNRVGEAFGMRDAPTLVTKGLHKSTMAVTELSCDARNFGKTAPTPPEDSYLVALQLRACPDHDLYFDGRVNRPENYAEGVTSIYDLRRSETGRCT